MGSLPRRTAYRSRASPRDGYIAVSKSGRAEPLSSLETDRELKDLEFALLGFGLTLVHYFLTIPHSFLLE